MGPIIDQNMQILKEVSEEIVPGYSERELLLKRFIFREQGCLFVYESSIPDNVHPDGQSSSRDDYDLYTLVFQITCFKAVGQDLIMEKIKQIDFRGSQSAKLMDQYLNFLSLKALYWQQDLIEKVADEVSRQ